MIVWRICKAQHAASAFSGDGAAKSPGRWNSAERPVVYLSQSLALAAFEVLVNAEDISLLSAIRWAAIPVEIDDALVTEAKGLPAGWDAIPAPASTHAFGDRWLDGKSSLVLRVPSAVVKGEFNFLLNPAHRDLAKIKIGRTEAFLFDKRLGRPKGREER